MPDGFTWIGFFVRFACGAAVGLLIPLGIMVDTQATLPVLLLEMLGAALLVGLLCGIFGSDLLRKIFEWM